jgi:hypothetical protein
MLHCRDENLHNCTLYDFPPQAHKLIVGLTELITPIKNSTTVVPANRSIAQIQEALVKHGAIGMLYRYAQGTGRIEALQCELPIKATKALFTLPVPWRKFQHVLEKQGVKRWRDEENVYRMAWRNMHDWVMAQLAFYATEIVDRGQVFLPFATDKHGQTFYEKMLDGRFLLGDGKPEESV